MSTLIYVVCFLLTNFLYPSHGEDEMYTNEYLLKIQEKDVEEVKMLANYSNFVFVKKVLGDLYLFKNTAQTNRSLTGNTSAINNLKSAVGNKVLLIEQQVFRKYLQLVIPYSKEPSRDGAVNRSNLPDVISKNYYDMGIEQAWGMGYKGLNVTIAVVDIGVAMNHADLMENMDRNLSYNYVDETADANPPSHTNYPDEVDLSHGTKCAGLVAAINGNNLCSSGVAPKAKLAAIRFLDENFDAKTFWCGASLIHGINSVDIYSNSWGSNSKCGFSKPGCAFLEAVSEGVTRGRNEKGSIYLFPAGNFGDEADCNADGYVNGVHVITIASVGINGSRPTFAQTCSCALAATLGEGSKFNTDTMFTTSNEINECTSDFKATSASVAIASGMVALALGANPHLTYRDVQHIIVNTASFELLQKSDDWMTNGAGRKVSPYFGFGLMNATAMVQAALNWTPVQERHTCTSNNVTRIGENEWRLFTDGCQNTCDVVEYLEHVQVNLTFSASSQSDVEFQLKSPMFPSNASSLLLTKRNSACKKVNDIVTWIFTTVHFWSEHPMGEWKLVMKLHNGATGYIVDASLILHGNGTVPLFCQYHLEGHPEGERSVAVLGIFIAIMTLIMASIYVAGCMRAFEVRGDRRTFENSDGRDLHVPGFASAR